MPDPLALTTKLNAVNKMLSAIGEAPFSSLDGELTVDGTTAVNTLDETSRKVQATGWHWNTDPDSTLTPDGGGLITMGSDVVSVDVNRDLFPDIDPVLRGSKLYNRSDRTYVWSKALTADVQYLLDWDSLPEAARQYIMIRAARIFQTESVGDTATYQFTAKDEEEALRVLNSYETRQLDANILRDDADLAFMLSRYI